MSFSIKTTIRAFVAPECTLMCPRPLWTNIVRELHRRGGNRHEAGVFLLGHESEGKRVVTGAIYYDELAPPAYESGVCILHAPAFAKLWSLCRERGVSVVGDAHTHPGASYQSESDRKNPMVARAGHVAIIIPDYARGGPDTRRLGVYEYRGNHAWTDRSPRVGGKHFFYAGLWS